jgi:hypothetical protein
MGTDPINPQMRAAEQVQAMEHRLASVFSGVSVDPRVTTTPLETAQLITAEILSDKRLPTDSDKAAAIGKLVDDLGHNPNFNSMDNTDQWAVLNAIATALEHHPGLKEQLISTVLDDLRGTEKRNENIAFNNKDYSASEAALTAKTVLGLFEVACVTGGRLGLDEPLGPTSKPAQ